MPESCETLELTELLQGGYRYALALTHQTHDAEDLAQEAWLNLSRRYGGVPSRPLLFTTIRNLFIDRYRRFRKINFEQLDGVSDRESAAPMETGTRDDLDQLLRALRPVEREAIFLHYIEGHTAEEIGVLTEQPRNTVLSLLSRALKKLQGARDVV